MALTAPPGLTAFAGARPKPSPVVRLFSTLVPRERIEIEIDTGAEVLPYSDKNVIAYIPEEASHKAPEKEAGADSVSVTLESLAWGRSGDKGSKANIGIIATASGICTLYRRPAKRAKGSCVFQSLP